MIGGALLWAALPPLDFVAAGVDRAGVLDSADSRGEAAASMSGILGLHAGGRHTGSLTDTRPPVALLLAAALLFVAWMLVTDWFHARKYAMFWASRSGLLARAGRALSVGLRGAGPRIRIVALWLAGMFFWLADLQWIRLPYWAIGFGWLALGVYFGLLSAGVRRPVAGRRPSPAAAGDARRASRLDRAGARAGASALRHDDGLPGAYAIPLDRH